MYLATLQAEEVLSADIGPVAGGRRRPNSVWDQVIRSHPDVPYGADRMYLLGDVVLRTAGSTEEGGLDMGEEEDEGEEDEDSGLEGGPGKEQDQQQGDDVRDEVDNVETAPRATSKAARPQSGEGTGEREKENRQGTELAKGHNALLGLGWGCRTSQLRLIMPQRSAWVGLGVPYLAAETGHKT